ncbi:hypothetical protein, partial [uncultured Microbulbifer sp.]|uniref:hypothetical protein n=1 Tax=uncultured Microbulbifer sp. TaxID=348147 RepID=UPI0026124218
MADAVAELVVIPLVVATGGAVAVVDRRGTVLEAVHAHQLVVGVVVVGHLVVERTGAAAALV